MKKHHVTIGKYVGALQKNILAQLVRESLSKNFFQFSDNHVQKL